MQTVKMKVTQISHKHFYYHRSKPGPRMRGIWTVL